MANSKGNDIILIYPEDQFQDVSFDFSVDEETCQRFNDKKWNLVKNSQVIFEENIAVQNGQIHIKYKNSFEISRINDFGPFLYFPTVCSFPISEQAISYSILYRPNITASADIKNYTRKDVLSINGNVTDWDSTNLIFKVLLNNKNIRSFNITKEKTTETIPFSINISLDSAHIGQNNITVFVMDNDGLSSNQTFPIQVQGIEPEFNVISNNITEYSKGDDINVKLSISKIDVAENLSVYYYVDESEKWILAKYFDINSDTKLPLNVDFNISSDLSEGEHTITLKCIDSNGMESSINSTMKIFIKKIIKTPTDTNQVNSHTPSIRATNSLSNQKSSSLSKRAIIIYGVVGVIVVIVTAIISVCIYEIRHKHVVDQCQIAANNEKQLNAIDMKIVVDQEGHIIDFNESNDFLSDECENILDASF